MQPPAEARDHARPARQMLSSAYSGRSLRRPQQGCVRAAAGPPQATLVRGIRGQDEDVRRTRDPAPQRRTSGHACPRHAAHIPVRPNHLPWYPNEIHESSGLGRSYRRCRCPSSLGPGARSVGRAAPGGKAPSPLLPTRGCPRGPRGCSPGGLAREAAGPGRRWGRRCLWLLGWGRQWGRRCLWLLGSFQLLGLDLLSSFSASSLRSRKFLLASR